MCEYYVSALCFLDTPLLEAGTEMNRLLEMGIDPILTNTEMLVTIDELCRALQTEWMNSPVFDRTGRERRGWVVEVSLRPDQGVVDGKLKIRGLGCCRFVKTEGRPISVSGFSASSWADRGTIMEAVKRLGIKV